MDTLLLVITTLSLTAAFVSVMAVRRLKHHEQLRSDARVAALVSAADDLPVPEPNKSGQRGAPRREGTWASVAGEWQWNPATEHTSHDDGGRELFAPSFRTAEVGLKAAAAEEHLFGTVRREAPASGRLAFVGALALLVALGGAAVIFTTSTHGKVAAPTALRLHTDPLELVSLGHAREASMLTITGIVRNPPSGPKLEGLTAVVSLIDNHGGLISTKDVPLDYRALGPGEEAPFKVTVPDPGSVARYRVSFRAGTDVVPHVDRRIDTKLASTL